MNPEASAKIYAAKGRPSDNPLIVHIAKLEDLEKIVKEIPDKAKKLAAAFWPGPLTMIFQKNDSHRNSFLAKHRLLLWRCRELRHTLGHKVGAWCLILLALNPFLESDEHNLFDPPMENLSQIIFQE